MIDGKLSNESRFLTGASKTAQKFSVGAFIFPDMISSSTSSQVLSRDSDPELRNVKYYHLLN